MTTSRQAPIPNPEFAWQHLSGDGDWHVGGAWTDRARVPGGHLYRTVYLPPLIDAPPTIALMFVPDPA